jgi:hypothetical protein
VFLLLLRLHGRDKGLDGIGTLCWVVGCVAFVYPSLVPVETEECGPFGRIDFDFAQGCVQRSKGFTCRSSAQESNNSEEQVLQGLFDTFVESMASVAELLVLAEHVEMVHISLWFLLIFICTITGIIRCHSEPFWVDSLKEIVKAFILLPKHW